MQHDARQGNALHTYCNTLQHTTAVQQHAAAHCSTLQHSFLRCRDTRIRNSNTHVWQNLFFPQKERKKCDGKSVCLIQSNDWSLQWLQMSQFQLRHRTYDMSAVTSTPWVYLPPFLLLYVCWLSALMIRVQTPAQHLADFDKSGLFFTQQRLLHIYIYIQMSFSPSIHSLALLSLAFSSLTLFHIHVYIYTQTRFFEAFGRLSTLVGSCVVGSFLISYSRWVLIPVAQCRLMFRWAFCQSNHVALSSWHPTWSLELCHIFFDVSSSFMS